GLTGVAPKAFLGNYNVFPGDITNATSHDIAQAIDDAVNDGMDVINMSLGGGINGFRDQLVVASNRAVKAGVVVAIAAGNSGPGGRAPPTRPPAGGRPAPPAPAPTNTHSSATNGPGETSPWGAPAGTSTPSFPAVTAQLANWNNTAAGASGGAATQACTPIPA